MSILMHKNDNDRNKSGLIQAFKYTQKYSKIKLINF